MSTSIMTRGNQEKPKGNPQLYWLSFPRTAGDQELPHWQAKFVATWQDANTTASVFQLGLFV